MTNSVKIISGALDDKDGDIILLGVIDPSSLSRLKVADYQREVLSATKISLLMEAHRHGSVPPIELGMRGHKCQERNEAFYLQDEVYIIDGQQRVTAALRLMELEPEQKVHIRAAISFGTTEEWERTRFDVLNSGQTKVSSNVKLRNLRRDFPAMAELYKLSEDRTFVMGGKITWSQNMHAGELISAMTFAKIAGMLHSHVGPGRGNDPVDLASGLQKIMENIGKTAFIANVRSYFDYVDQCFGLKLVAYRNSAVHLKTTFAFSLAKVFSEHPAFWTKEDRLVVDAGLLRKLRQFPINDPTVSGLASSAGKAGDMLFMMFVDHLNSGRRTRRLVPRNYVEPLSVEPVTESSDPASSDE